MKADVLKVNQLFYEAFAAGDYPALEKLWARTDSTSVIHPGSAVVHGRTAVMLSWKQILDGSGGSNILCANATAYIHGDTAYVTCNEVFPEGQLIATNIFIRESGDWRMVHHQAGPDRQTSPRKSPQNRSVH